MTWDLWEIHAVWDFSWDTLKELTCICEGKWRKPIRCHMQKKVNPMLFVFGKSALVLSSLILSTETITSYSGYHLTDTLPPNYQRLAENRSFTKYLFTGFGFQKAYKIEADLSATAVLCPFSCSRHKKTHSYQKHPYRAANWLLGFILLCWVFSFTESFLW